MSDHSVRVRANGVSKRYMHRVKGEVYAARDVTLDVAPGEFLTLLGPSGCGKTTVLRLIAGFEKPDTGRVHFDDRDVTDLPADLRGIGFVFQNYALFPHLSVFENVAYGLRVRREAEDVIARRTAEVLALVGLSGYEQQFSAQLSGGEQQRVALARAIVIRPKVLLFDEPLSNLDAKLRIQMRHEIRSLQRRLGITTVYVTHDQEEAMAVSDRIAVINQGAVVQLGTAHDLYYRPASRFVATFIGRGNMVPGRVGDLVNGGGTIDALGTRIAAAVFPSGLAPGDAVELMVRPEAVEVLRDGEPAALRATVVAHSFLGEKVEYALRCGDAALQAIRYGAGPGDVIADGASVGLKLAAAGVTVLPASAA